MIALKDRTVQSIASTLEDLLKEKGYELYYEHLEDALQAIFNTGNMEKIINISNNFQEAFLSLKEALTDEDLFSHLVEIGAIELEHYYGEEM